MEMSAVLRAVFDTLNQGLFERSLSIRSFGVDPAKPAVCRWVAEAGELLAGHLAISASLYAFKVSVLHEMLHVHNAANNVQDESVNNYHNKNFAVSAALIGLYCVRHKKHGWSLLSLAPPCNVIHKSAVRAPRAAANARLIEAFDAVQVGRKEWNAACRAMRRAVQQMVPGRIFQHKYVCQCPPPHNSVRCGRRPDGHHAPDISCNRCKAKFICES